MLATTVQRQVVLEPAHSVGRRHDFVITVSELDGIKAIDVIRWVNTVS